MPWHAPVFLLNSRLGRFSAAGLGSPWRVTYHRHPLSRSYGVILPSSFSVNHSSPLGCSPRPPVSDYGTVNCCCGPRSFSRQCASATLWIDPKVAPSASVLDYPGGFAYQETSTTLQRNPPSAGNLAPASLLGLIAFNSWYGNVDPFPIDYASRPRLRDRLTLS